MNRAERRKQDKGQRNNIKMNQMKKEAIEAGIHASYMILAGSLLALHQQDNYGANRLIRIVKLTQTIVDDALSATELIERLKTETGVDLDFCYKQSRSGLGDAYEP